MNVLGKIKSKKNNVLNTQHPQIQEKTQFQQIKQDQVQKEIKKFQPQSYQSQLPSKNINRKNEEKKLLLPVNPLDQPQFIENANPFTHEKQVTSIRGKGKSFMKTTTSISNNYFPSFQPSKPSKNSTSGVYFDSNNSARSSTFFAGSNTSKQQSKNKLTDSFGENQSQEMNVEFDFLLSNKEKIKAKKSIHLSKGKIQNQKLIQNELKQQNEEVLCFYVKKWAAYGDIFLLEGQLASLKKGFIQIDLHGAKKEISNKIKIKLSFGRDVFPSPETIGRIYISKIDFLSEQEGMIVHEYFLRAIQKGRKFHK